MKYFSSILFCFILIPVLLSQEGEDLISRITTSEYRIYDDPSTIGLEYRQLYYYNEKSQLYKELNQRRNLDHNILWITQQETYYTYNHRGKTIKSISFDYEGDNKTYSYTVNYKWQGDQLIEIERDYHRNQENSGYKELEVFDSLGRKVILVYIDYDHQGNNRKRTLHFKYDSNGCLQETITENIVNIDIDTIKIRSKHVRILNPHCRLTGGEIWGYNYEYNIFELRSRYKYEYVEDEFGNIVYESYSEQMIEEDDDFALIYESFNTFDHNGNVILTEILRNDSKSKIEMAYNSMNLLIEQRYYFWDFNNEVWIPDFEYYYTYDQDSNVLDYRFYGFYDTITNTFLGRSHFTYQYNSDHLKLSEEWQFENLIDPSNPEFSHNRTDYQYECNGRIQSSSYKNIISKNGSQTKYFYHNVPLCSDLNNKLSEEIKIFPNPASEYVHFTVNIAFDEMLVSIYDMNGRKVNESKHSGQGLISIPIDHLENGIYSIIAEINLKTYLGNLIKL